MRRLVAGLVLAAVAVPCAAAPAHAAEAGGARLLAAPAPGAESTAVHGSCRTWSSSTGSYGARCSGGGTARSFRDLLGGAEPPTCWLLPRGSSDPAPKDLTPFGAATPAPLPTPAPDPTATPTATPTGVPTATPTAEPTTTPTAAPTAAPTGPPGALPTATPTGPVPTTTELPGPTATVPVELPAEFVEACLTPTPDRDSLAPAWNSSIVLAPVWVLLSAPGRPPAWWELTPGQRRYVTFAVDSGSITEGTVITSPSRSPRIGQVVAFSVAHTDSREVSIGNLRMRARLVGLSVDPGEPGRDPVTCTGPGQVLAAGATGRTGPGICSFSYDETSGGRGTSTADTFDVTATETWHIEVSSDSGATWGLDRVVEKTVLADLRVTEVQTLVVPLAP